jgi:hypothetical protein
MNQNKTKTSLLESVFNYYSDRRNYIKESVNEDGLSVCVDDAMFNDIMDMIKHNVFEKIEDGQILIPTMGAYTFHITPDNKCYLDDDNGNEHEVEIDNAKLQTILQAIQTPVISEKISNPFTGVQQDPETGFVTFTKKDNVSQNDAIKSAHDAIERAKSRRKSQEDDSIPDTLQDKRNNPEYMSKVNAYWNNRKNNMAEPHGFGTSGTKTLFPIDEMDDDSVYDLANDDKGDKAQFAAKGMGYINEDKIRHIVSNIIEQILK